MTHKKWLLLDLFLCTLSVNCAMLRHDAPVQICPKSQRETPAKATSRRGAKGKVSPDQDKRCIIIQINWCT